MTSGAPFPPQPVWDSVKTYLKVYRHQEEPFQEANLYLNFLHIFILLEKQYISVMVAEMLCASFQENGFRIKDVIYFLRQTLPHRSASEKSQPTRLCEHKLEAIHNWGLFSCPNQDRGYLQKFSWDLKTHFMHSEGLFQQLENIQQSVPASSPDPYISNSKSHKRPIQKSLPFRRWNKEHNIPV